MSERIEKIIEYLEGSSLSLRMACEDLEYDYDDLTNAELGELDEHIGCCEHCSWWVPASELDEDAVCGDCVE